jgi:type I restriction enzyme, S subunit
MGATTPHLYQRDIVTFSIYLPPLIEQEQIVQKLERLSIQAKKLESNYQQKLNDLDELKKSILQKAFSGELKTLENEMA